MNLIDVFDEAAIAMLKDMRIVVRQRARARPFVVHIRIRIRMRMRRAAPEQPRAALRLQWRHRHLTIADGVLAASAGGGGGSLLVRDIARGADPLVHQRCAGGLVARGLRDALAAQAEELLEERGVARVGAEGGEQDVADDRDEADGGREGEVEDHALREPPGYPERRREREGG